jgi:hypothetical protein
MPLVLLVGGLTIFFTAVVAAGPAFPLMVWIVFGLGVFLGTLYGLVVIYLKLYQGTRLDPTPEGNYPIPTTRALIPDREPFLLEAPKPGNNRMPTHYAPHKTLQQERPHAPNVITAQSRVIDAPIVDVPPDHVDLMPSLLNLKKTGKVKQDNFDIYMGETAQGPLIVPLDDARNTGIVGTTGGGKSAAQRNILFQLVLADPRGRRIELNLLDLEGRELRLFKPYMATKFYTEDERIASEFLIDQADVLEDLCRKTEEEILEEPYRLYVVEESIDFRDAITMPAADAMDKMLRRGRKCRMYFVGASQLFNSGVVGRYYKQMMVTRACFRTEAESAKAFGFNPQLLDLLDRPGRFAYNMLMAGRGIAQAPFVTKEQVKALYPPDSLNRIIEGDGNYMGQDAEELAPGIGETTTSGIGQMPHEAKVRNAWHNGARTIPKLKKAVPGLSHYYANKWRQKLLKEESEE